MVAARWFALRFASFSPALGFCGLAQRVEREAIAEGRGGRLRLLLVLVFSGSPPSAEEKLVLQMDFLVH